MSLPQEIVPIVFFGLSLEHLLVVKRVCTWWRTNGREMLDGAGWHAAHVSFEKADWINHVMLYSRLLPFNQEKTDEEETDVLGQLETDISAGLAVHY